MNARRRSILEVMDDALRWTGFPARVAEDMSDAPSVDRKHRPRRWMPVLPIAFSCSLFILFLDWPPVLNGISPASGVSIMVPLMCSLVGMLQVIHSNGPLAKPALEDDEREAALRKDSFLFCFGMLAALNCFGQPVLMFLSQWEHWQTSQSVLVAAWAFMLNATLFVCLPPLYASWHLQQLPKE